MKIYVAGPLADIKTVQRVQDAVVAAGHELTMDWSSSPGPSLQVYDAEPDAAGRLAGAMLDAVLAADAVLVLATENDGRGMFVELGAALAAARRSGAVKDIAVIGQIRHESIFYFHPAVTRAADVDEWLAGSGVGSG